MASGEGNGPAARRNSFDAVRLSAALCVFAGHECDLLGLPEPTLGPLGITLSNMGLFIFFALSGYLVAGSLARDPRPAAFLRARALRIFPGAAANSMACVLLGAAVTTLPARRYWADTDTWSYLAHNAVILIPPTPFTLPGVFADAPWPSVDTPVWTLKYELACYMALLAFGTATRAIPRARAPALATVALLLVISYVLRTALLAQPQADDFYSRYNGFNALRFFMIFTGGVLYATAEVRGAAARLGVALVPAALVVLAPRAEVARAGLLLLVVPLAVELGRSSLLFSARYRALGDLSYGLYLYGYPIQVLLLTRGAGRLGILLSAIAALTLALACAAVSWHAVEKPALLWKTRARGSGGAAPADPPNL